MRPLHEVAPEDRAAIAGIDVQEFNNADGAVVRSVRRIRLERKQPALETLAEMHGLLPEKNIFQAMGWAVNIHLGPDSLNGPPQPALEIPDVTAQVAQVLESKDPSTKV